MSMNSFHSRQKKPRAAAVEAAKVAPAPLARAEGMLRVDALLVQQGLAASRTAAQKLIEAGRVSWAGGIVVKAALELPVTVVLQVAAGGDGDEDRYVSRGGLKLAGALKQASLSVAGKTCLDVGQSTGGFTDCLLQAGARHVTGVDVGHGQLHGRLRHDPRITAIEGVNCRALGAADLGSALPEAGFDLIVGDLSFISLTLILPQLPPLLAADGRLLLLVKPQFEVGPENLGKGGIVRDPALYAEVETKLRACAATLGLQVLAWLDSPIHGGDGNREFFILLKK